MLTDNQIKTFRNQGYLVVPQVFTSKEIDTLRSAYDDILNLASRADLDEKYKKGISGGVHIHIQAPPDVPKEKRTTFLRKVQWPAMIHPTFETFRTHPKFPALLEGIIGTSLKQYINQINFKMPGGEIEFPWHQDVRPEPAFRDQVNNYVQTIIAVDDATEQNGCLWIVPGSHKKGNLRVKRYAEGQIEDHIDVSNAMPCNAQAGDVVMFTSYTVHGSKPNTTSSPRRSYINGFVRASACDVGKWAFLEGQPVPITSDLDYNDIRFASAHHTTGRVA